MWSNVLSFSEVYHVYILYGDALQSKIVDTRQIKNNI